MNIFMIVAGFYFFYELVINGLVPTLQSATDQFDPYENVIQQYYDMIIIFFLMYNFRSRVWPEYFTIGLLDTTNM